MNENQPQPALPASVPDTKPQLDDGLIAWTHVIYGLHALAIAIGMTSAVTIVGAFVFGVPSIVGVVLTYIKRAEARGTFLESHYRWLLRTFWIAVLGGLLAGLITLMLVLTIVGVILAWIPFLVVGVWLFYRIVRGWLALKDRTPLSD